MPQVNAVQLKGYLLNVFDAKLTNCKDFRTCLLLEANQEQVQVRKMQMFCINM